MELRHRHPWPGTAAEALAVQDRLRPLLDLTGPGPRTVRLAAGLDVSYATPDLLVCDGHGLAHPRRFGLACHLGVLTGLPSVGVGKTPLLGAYQPPCEERGSCADMRDGGEVVGRALRTQRGVKPVFVSAGHRIDLDTATRHVLALSPRYRLPETTRRADSLSRTALAGQRT